MKNSLFVRIYFSFIAVGLIVLLGTGGVGFFLLSKAKAGQNLKGTVEWILERLPDAKKNRSFFRRAFRQLAEQSQSKIGLWDERGRRLAVSERWTLRPHQECNDSIWIKPTQQEIGLCFALKDGRWFAIAFKREQYTEIRNQIFILFGLLLFFCAFPNFLTKINYPYQHCIKLTQRGLETSKVEDFSGM